MNNQPPAARNTDPFTSHLSSAEITNSGQRTSQSILVSQLVADAPGKTSQELAHMSNNDRHMIARRLPDAERFGWVMRGPAKTCSITNKKALTWFPTSKAIGSM